MSTETPPEQQPVADAETRGEARAEAASEQTAIDLNLRILDLEERLRTAEAQREAMRSTLEVSQVNRNRVASELANLKEKVVRVALDYAGRHGWCDTVKEALKEMGLEIPKKTVSFTVTATWTVEATVEHDVDPDEYWIVDHIEVDYPSGSYSAFDEFDASEDGLTVDNVSVSG